VFSSLLACALLRCIFTASPPLFRLVGATAGHGLPSTLKNLKMSFVRLTNVGEQRERASRRKVYRVYATVECLSKKAAKCGTISNKKAREMNEKISHARGAAAR
jgi:hypothetical protein